MKKRVLIVDDCKFFLETLQDSLSVDYQVVKARSGEEAVALLEQSYAGQDEAEGVDLIITDLQMPGLSGYDVAKFVREKNRARRYTPVIMLTGLDITKEEARRHGCAAYIPKGNMQKVVSMANILMMR